MPRLLRKVRPRAQREADLRRRKRRRIVYSVAKVTDCVLACLKRIDYGKLATERSNYTKWATICPQAAIIRIIGREFKDFQKVGLLGKPARGENRDFSRNWEASSPGTRML